MTSVRSAADISDHGPPSTAARAAATARSTSASAASGADPTTSSVAGFTTSKVFEVEGSIQSPPMYRRSNERMLFTPCPGPRVVVVERSSPYLTTHQIFPSGGSTGG